MKASRGHEVENNQEWKTIGGKGLKTMEVGTRSLKQSGVFGADHRDRIQDRHRIQRRTAGSRNRIAGTGSQVQDAGKTGHRYRIQLQEDADSAQQDQQAQDNMSAVI